MWFFKKAGGTLDYTARKRRSGEKIVPEHGRHVQRQDRDNAEGNSKAKKARYMALLSQGAEKWQIDRNVLKRLIHTHNDFSNAKGQFTTSGSEEDENLYAELVQAHKEQWRHGCAFHSGIYGLMALALFSVLVFLLPVLIALVFSLVWAVLLYLAAMIGWGILYFVWQLIYLFYSGSEGEGIVVGFDESLERFRRSSHVYRMYSPIVDFCTTDGRTIRKISGTYTRKPSRQIGDKVTVRYDPDDPHTAMIGKYL